MIFNLGGALAVQAVSLARAGRALGAAMALLAAMLAPNMAAAQTFTLTLQPNTIPAATQGSFFSQTITAVGGNAPYTFAVIAGALPPGINLSSGGLLSGTSNSPNSYTFTIEATDDDGNTGFRPYTFSVGETNLLSMSPSSLPNGTQGVGYSQQVTASGGSGGYVYSIVSGSLPNGLNINSGNGAISGTPSQGGTFNFTVRARDSDGNTGNRAYTVNIGSNSLSLSPSSLSNGTVGTPYSQNINASGGSGDYTYSISSGSLPNGLNINTNNGVISGTPTQGGSFSFTVRAIDDNTSDFGTRSYTVNIGTNSLTINPSALPGGTVGASYSQGVSASGGTGGYSYSVESGALPPGLSLNSGNGAIVGTPTTDGAFSFTIGAIDSGFNTGSRSYTVNIGLTPLTVSPSSLPAATQNAPYAQTITASGGSAPYSFIVLSGSLPPGLSLSSSGDLSGTPTATGAFSFTVQATDPSPPNTGTRAYTLTVGGNILTVSPSSLPNGSQGAPYSQTVGASGGVGPYSFAVTAGALPDGLSLNPGTGAITGTPTGSGPYSFTIGASDSAGNIGSRAYLVNIGTNSLTVSPSSLPAGTQGFAYDETISASGGTGPYSFAVTAGALPGGLALNPSTGALSGTPSAGGTFSFTVRAVDINGNFGARDYALTIGTDSLTLNPTTLPPAVIGRPYSATVTGAGGTAPYLYALIGGALPPGLALNPATGAITGTPTGAGNFTFTLRVRDANGNIGSRTYDVFPVRPDPANDAEMRALVASQVATTRRFVHAQATNVMRHLEGLHDRFNPCSVDMGLALPGPQPQQQPGYYDPFYNSQGVPPGLRPVNAQGGDEVARRTPYDECAGRPAGAAGVGFWLGGAIDFGSGPVNGAGTAAARFSTSGVTGGIDMRVARDLIVGGAIGYAMDRSEVGQNGTRSDATAFTGAAYLSYRAFGRTFIDGVLGYGKLSFDNRRHVALDGALATGAREGTTMFAGVTASTELLYDGLKVVPYLRADYSQAQLDGFSEKGGSIGALTYGAISFSTFSAGLGVRASYEMAMSWGVLAPNARLEYRRGWDGGFNQAVHYSDLGPGTASTWVQSALGRDLLGASVGMRAAAGEGLAVDVEYGVSMVEQALQSQSVRGAFKLAF